VFSSYALLLDSIVSSSFLLNLFGAFHSLGFLNGAFAFLFNLIGSICKRWIFHVSLVQVLVSSWSIEHWSNSIKSAYSFSNSSWFHKMSKNQVYLASGIISTGLPCYFVIFVLKTNELIQPCISIKHKTIRRYTRSKQSKGINIHVWCCIS